MVSLIVLIGPPGAGKSTFAAACGGTVVSTDAIRRQLYGGESSTRCEPVAQQLLRKKHICTDGLDAAQLAALKESLCVDHVFDVARDMCCRLLAEGKNVIYDSTNFKRKYRRQLLEKTNGLYRRCDAYFLDIPLEVCLVRNAARQRREPEDVIAEICACLDPPSYEEGFDNIYRVDESGRISRIPNQ